VAPSGDYAAEITEKPGGSCMTMTGAPPLPPWKDSDAGLADCVGGRKIRTTSDLCELELEQDCDNGTEPAETHIQIRSKLEQTPGSGRIEGTISVGFKVYQTAQTCHSEYAVSYVPR
jgi:hypothetical protein